MVCIQYKVDTEHQAQFFALMEQLKRIRLRDGGYSRGLFSVPGTQDEFMETFMVSSPQNITVSINGQPWMIAGLTVS